MHDRFILTDIGGICLGQGLDEVKYDASAKVLALALEHKTYKKEYSKVRGTPQSSASVKK